MDKMDARYRQLADTLAAMDSGTILTLRARLLQRHKGNARLRPVLALLDWHLARAGRQGSN